MYLRAPYLLPVSLIKPPFWCVGQAFGSSHSSTQSPTYTNSLGYAERQWAEPRRGDVTYTYQGQASESGTSSGLESAIKGIFGASNQVRPKARSDLECGLANGLATSRSYSAGGNRTTYVVGDYSRGLGMGYVRELRNESGVTYVVREGASTAEQATQQLSDYTEVN